MSNITTNTNTKTKLTAFAGKSVKVEAESEESRKKESSKIKLLNVLQEKRGGGVLVAAAVAAIKQLLTPLAQSKQHIFLSKKREKTSAVQTSTRGRRTLGIA